MYELIAKQYCIGSIGLQICDRASDNGPSGHTNFDHIFHICCIITNDLLKQYHRQHFAAYR